MTRDFWLAHPQDLHKIADANFLVGDEVEEAKPGAIAENAKEKVDREWFFLSGHAPIIYGLTDMNKEAYLTIHTHKRMYVDARGGPMTTDPVKALKAHVAIHVKHVP